MGTAAIVIYGVGVLVGVAVMRDPMGARLVQALAWPLGPIAFIVTVSILIITAVIALPLAGAVVIAAGLIAWTLGRFLF